MESKSFGYARVSTARQKEDRQVEALMAYGIEERNIIIDKESGEDMDRHGYQCQAFLKMSQISLNISTSFLVLMFSQE